jgi:hypothetical protein
MAGTIVALSAVLAIATTNPNKTGSGGKERDMTEFEIPQPKRQLCFDAGKERTYWGYCY